MMTAKEFAGIRAAAGMSLTELAEYLGVQRRTVERYGAGERKIPGPVVKLMELLKAKGGRKVRS
jgi:DNA-binding transcriptional regulator YiaG